MKRKETSRPKILYFLHRMDETFTVSFWMKTVSKGHCCKGNKEDRTFLKNMMKEKTSILSKKVGKLIEELVKIT
jgi:hypothetical protein